MRHRTHRRRSRRRNRRGGQPTPRRRQRKRKKNRSHGKWKDRAERRRKNKTVKATNTNDPIVWKQNPLFKGKTEKQFVEQHKKYEAAAKQAAKKAANKVAQATNAAANQVATEAGKKAGQKRAHPTWRETATIAAERKLEEHYGSKRPQTQLGNVQAKGNAAWKAANATTALRRVAWDARTKREKAAAAKAAGAAVEAGKQAANEAANKVVAAVNSAANSAAQKGAFMCCPPGTILTRQTGAGRRRYAKNEARAGPRRRRRSRRR